MSIIRIGRYIPASPEPVMSSAENLPAALTYPPSKV